LIFKSNDIRRKVGQLNQYNGFWEITGPTPKEGQQKYEDLKGLSWFYAQCKGVEDVRSLQKNCC
jgi:beta-glucosidase